LAQRYGINPKTVAKWKKYSSVADLPVGPKHSTSTVLSIEEEAIVVAFRRHTLLALDEAGEAQVQGLPDPLLPHRDIAEVRTEEGKLYLFVAIDRTAKIAFVALHEKADRPTAVCFLEPFRRPGAAVPLRLRRLTNTGLANFLAVEVMSLGSSIVWRQARFQSVGHSGLEISWGGGGFIRVLANASAALLIAFAWVG